MRASRLFSSFELLSAASETEEADVDGSPGSRSSEEDARGTHRAPRRDRSRSRDRAKPCDAPDASRAHRRAEGPTAALDWTSNARRVGRRDASSTRPSPRWSATARKRPRDRRSRDGGARHAIDPARGADAHPMRVTSRRGARRCEEEEEETSSEGDDRVLRVRREKGAVSERRHAEFGRARTSPAVSKIRSAEFSVVKEKKIAEQRSGLQQQKTAKKGERPILAKPHRCSSLKELEMAVNEALRNGPPLLRPVPRVHPRGVGCALATLAARVLARRPQSSPRGRVHEERTGSDRDSRRSAREARAFGGARSAHLRSLPSLSRDLFPQP
jgi:hypothetical protein